MYQLKGMENNNVSDTPVARPDQKGKAGGLNGVNVRRNYWDLIPEDL